MRVIGPVQEMSAYGIELSDLKASINGKDIPEEVKGRLLGLHEENVQVKEQLKTTQEKLSKARAVSCDVLDEHFLFSTVVVYQRPR